MKYLILLFFVPTLASAGFSKPKLLARLMDSNAWNAPDNMWCFSGEPMALKNEVYLNCFDAQSDLMARWNQDGFKVIARAGNNNNLFSKPVRAFDQMNWYEFDEYSVLKGFASDSSLRVTPITNLGPLGSEPTDSLLPLTKTSFFFKNKWGESQLWSWENGKVSPFYNPKAGFIFTLQPGIKGEIAVKIREEGLSESSPDRLMLYHNNQWKVVFEDKDANPSSPWISFRHQLSVEGDKILLIARDSKGDALVFIDGDKTQVIARAGVELKSFDFFTPKYRAGVMAVRGEDFEGHKVTYVKDEGKFRKLVAQGDIVHTDTAIARIFYQSRDAIFYGAPGIDEVGNIYLQATLTEADNASTLLGIGLLKFNKE